MTTYRVIEENDSVTVITSDAAAQVAITATLSPITRKWHLSGWTTHANGDSRRLYVDGEFRGDRDDAEREAWLAACDETRWHDT